MFRGAKDASFERLALTHQQGAATFELAQVVRVSTSPLNTCISPHSWLSFLPRSKFQT
jgi:hypothetical protein